MSRVGPMHPVFAVIWTAFAITSMAYLYFVDHVWWGDLGFFLWFASCEGAAVYIRKEMEWQGALKVARDTLSQYATWVARMAKPGTRWYESWNAPVVIFAVHLSWMWARNVPPNELTLGLPIQQATFGLMVGFLVFHWLRPDRVG